MGQDNQKIKRDIRGGGKIRLTLHKSDKTWSGVITVLQFFFSSYKILLKGKLKFTLNFSKGIELETLYPSLSTVRALLISSYN